MMKIDRISDSAERILDGMVGVLIWTVAGLMVIIVIVQAAIWAAHG